MTLIINTLPLENPHLPILGYSELHPLTCHHSHPENAHQFLLACLTDWTKYPHTAWASAHWCPVSP
jgi:hypothetical protein